MPLFPDREIAARLERALAEDMRAYVHTLNDLYADYGATATEVGGGIAVQTGFINGVTGMGSDQTVSEADFEALEAFFGDQHFTVGITPFADDDMLNLLHTRGYHLSDFDIMYARSLTDPITPIRDSNVEVCVPTDEEAWVNVAMTVYPAHRRADTRLARAAFHRPATTCFVANLDGVTIGASALSMRNGVATLYFTATEPNFRGHGAQSAMIYERLIHARAAGCEIAYATTLPGNASMRNVLRSGFQMMYTRLSYTSPTS